MAISITALQDAFKLVNNANATSGTASGVPSIQTASTNPTPTASTPTTSTADYRLRLAPLNASFFAGKMFAPLQTTGNAIVFPYQPQVNVVHGVDYPSMQMTHSNQDYYYYARTNNVTININAKFTVQNKTEGLYALAALHFMRTVTKMRFGQDDPDAGLPPMICKLSGYGTYNFNEVRVIVKGHNFTFDEKIDMVTVAVEGGGDARLPALFSLGVELIVQQTGNYMRTKFSLDSYRNGNLLEQGGYI